ncbi:periplasmic heavy metal sensor [Haloferula rosea]|uniref:Periplasmic heavy metal sensor n=1 Tax=Haloferula rosea TaxID=490093 RepID=A0A934R9B4_9BACT|nr:periplasmic heavy metal sensor [Haloferula rosea]MBK1827579.1 periplasmic heavy metal sensor [Haloferula rosea]
MRRPGEIILWGVSTVVLAGLTAWFVGSRSGAEETAGQQEQDLHRWMHERLVLSPSQHEMLEPIEHAYDDKRRELEGKISEAGRRLAQAVGEGDQESPEVAAALADLSQLQSELQRATLNHYFVMKDQLDPEQAEKLLEWIRRSIVHE